MKKGSSVNLLAVGPFLFGSRFAPAAIEAVGVFTMYRNIYKTMNNITEQGAGGGERGWHWMWWYDDGAIEDEDDDSNDDDDIVVVLMAVMTEW